MPLLVDTWYFVAVTYDSAVSGGTMILYKNGVEVSGPKAVATGVGTPVLSGTPTTYIGSFNGAFNFNGKIDNVMVFDRALAAEEIEHLYNKGNGIEGLVIGQMDADINGDGDVDFLDFAKLGAAW